MVNSCVGVFVEDYESDELDSRFFEFEFFGSVVGYWNVYDVEESVESVYKGVVEFFWIFFFRFEFECIVVISEDI